jgi:hypothetical protein
MGLSLEFYAGNADAIGAAFAAVEWDRIRRGTDAIAYADLSLHVSPDDLDLLSEVIAEHAAQAPLLLLDCLTRTVGTIDDEGAAQLVDPNWVTMVARLSPGDASPIASEWVRRVGDAYPLSEPRPSGLSGASADWQRDDDLKPATIALPRSGPSAGRSPERARADRGEPESRPSTWARAQGADLEASTASRG